MTPTAKGRPRIVSAYTRPPTSLRRIRLIVTELAVIEPSDAGVGLRDVAHDGRFDHGVESTAAELISNDEVPVMPVVT
jgi:acetate CoA/acetoacetate CoA-transferase beta subunit